MKIEPFSIIAAVLALMTFFVGGIIGNVLLIVAAIFMSFSYKRFKNDGSYTPKWPLYVAAAIITGTIIIRLLGITIFTLF